MSASLRAVVVGTLAVLLRLSREGMVLRALAWPGLLAAVALVGTASVVAAFGGREQIEPHVALSAEEVAIMGPSLDEVGLTVRLDPDPTTAVQEGRAERAAWREGEGWVLSARDAGVHSLRAEMVLREEAGASWRPVVAPEPPAGKAATAQAGRMGALVAVLFVLYGVVMGAGLAWRDRGEGVVEASLPLPVPAWTHGASRVLGLGIALGGGLWLTILLLHGLIGMERPSAWAGHGALGAAVSAAVGLATTGGAGAQKKGFSAGLSRAMVLVAGLLGLGFGLPWVGAWLPVASLAAAGAGPWSPVADVVVVLLSALSLAACAGWWGRHHGGLGR
ncbi:MAG: hypothetical protein H6742_22240 [Alphaproteobacteria bacterium]|nr:hypothetical protein [Alphaproteobacteria bacterium]